MSEPYYTAKPGDTIQSRQWNDIQSRLRDEIQSHTHSGGDQGIKLSGAAIDPSAELSVSKLSVSSSLSVGSPPQLVVSPAGNVGLGTTDPGSDRLRIVGTLRADAVATLKLTTGTLDVADALTTSTLAVGSKLTVGSVVGIGTASPVAKLDVAQAARTGTHPTSVLGAYITGDFLADSGVEIRHSNATQGIGLGFNTIYAAGSSADQDLNLKPRGKGAVNHLGSGKMTSPMWKVTQVLNNSAVPGPSSPGATPGAASKTASFTTGGGTLVLLVSGSAFVTSAPGTIGIDVRIDNVSVGGLSRCVNTALTHAAFVVNAVVAGGIAAGSHTLTLVNAAGTYTDFNDYFSATVLELPF